MNMTNIAGHLDNSHSTSYFFFNSSTQLLATTSNSTLPITRKKEHLNNYCSEAKYLISPVFHLSWPQLANDHHIPSLFSNLSVCFGKGRVNVAWSSIKCNRIEQPQVSDDFLLISVVFLLKI